MVASASSCESAVDISAASAPVITRMCTQPGAKLATMAGRTESGVLNSSPLPRAHTPISTGARKRKLTSSG